MGKPVFSRSGTTYGGAIAADATKIVFSTGAGQPAGSDSPTSGLLTENTNIQLAQRVMRVYELDSSKFYYVAGRSEGNFSFAQVVGPKPIQIGFIEQFGDVCNAANNNMNLLLSTACADNLTIGGSGTLAVGILTGVLTSIGITVNANDMMINQQIAGMFGSMELST